MKRVVIESPFAGKTPEETEANVRYARACVRDSLLRVEAPIASHLLYTQPGILNDAVPDERALGMKAGLAWADSGGELSAIYIDRGISPGMKSGITRAEKVGRPVEMRRLGESAPQVANKLSDALVPVPSFPTPEELSNALLAVGIVASESDLIEHAPGKVDVEHAAAWARQQHEHTQGRGPAPGLMPSWLSRFKT